MSKFLSEVRTQELINEIKRRDQLLGEAAPHWIGTQAQLEAEILAGRIKDGTIVGITDDESVVTHHEVTAAEWEEIFENLPGNNPNGFIIDLRNTEYVVGKFIQADGKSKPIYQKSFEGQFPTVTTNGQTIENTGTYPITVTNDCDQIIDCHFVLKGSSNPSGSGNQILMTNGGVFAKVNCERDGGEFKVRPVANAMVVSEKYCYITVQYTKTTDTAT